MTSETERFQQSGADIRPGSDHGQDAHAASHLQWVLREGQLAVVAEYVPPTRPDAQAVKATAAALRNKVDAVGVVDNRLEITMSAVATATILQTEGVEPIVHVATRDRNRIALMSDILGAYALGLRNFLCTSGDHQTLGRERASRNVFDLDSVQLLSVLDRLRCEGILFSDGRNIGPCDFCLGAAVNPAAGPAELQAFRLAKKIKAGADFVITQPVFDADAFGRWLADMGIQTASGNVAILAGILVPPSAAVAREMRDKVPGIEIPDAVIARLESVAPEEQRDEAITLAIELIGRLRVLNSVRGFCLMTAGDNAATVEVIEKAGLRR
jgi:methylenetetrahydrofolate reductase (NADPH)